MTDLPQARAAKEHLRERLRDCAGVVGVGIARSAGGYCIRVNVADEDAAGQVPADVDGVEVRIAVVGGIAAQA